MELTTGFLCGIVWHTVKSLMGWDGGGWGGGILLPKQLLVIESLNFQGHCLVFFDFFKTVV